MLEIEREKSGNLVKTVAVGRLTTDDYKKLRPILEETLKEWKKLRWYFEMRDFGGWSAGAAWEDLKFDIAHATDLEKIAMVGDKQWESWLSKLMMPFTTAEVRYFSLEQREEALRWVQS